MEKIRVIGNLTKDPVVNTSQSGRKYCNFTVAANSNVRVRNADGTYGTRKVTNYYRVTVWGTDAEVCGQYLQKGRKVEVYGTLTIEFARDQSTNKLIFRNNPDGTKSDEPLLNLNINQEGKVEFLSNVPSENADGEHPAAAQPAATQETAPAAEAPAEQKFTKVDVDDELPF